MALAEGAATGGSWLGAAFTFVLYGALPRRIALYLLGTPARRRAPPPRRAAAQPGPRAIQTAAAMRPGDCRRAGTKRTVTRRSTVHQRRRRRARRPAAARRSRASPARSASHLPPPCAHEATARASGRAGSAPNASSTSAPTSNASRRRCRRRARRRARPARSRPRSHSACDGRFDDAGRRARASPRARRRRARPSGAANSTGRQSATCTVQATPGSVVTAGVGLVHRRRRRGVGGADPDDARAVDLAQEDRRARRIASREAARGCARPRPASSPTALPRFIAAYGPSR